MSEPTSLSTVIFLVTIPFAEKSAVARRGLVRWHWKGIWVFLGVISIFLVARLTTHYTESVIHIMSLDVIKEATITVAEFDSIKVYWVILWCQC